VIKATLIYNPAAGQLDVTRDLQEAVSHLEEQGWRITWKRTHGRGDATTFAREAVAAGQDVVIVAGGDCTIGEAANGLAYSQVVMGVLPIGTGNVWAREVGYPVSSLSIPLRDAVRELGWGLEARLFNPLVEAARVLAEGHVRCIDLGKAIDVHGLERYFVMWSGIGLDAQVAQEVELHQHHLKRRMGILTYIVAGILTALHFRGSRVSVLVDGRRVTRRAILVVLGNAQLYGGVVRLTARAQLDDGLLDVCVFRGHNTLAVLRHILGVFLGRHLRDPQVDYYQARQVSIHTAKPLPVHMDGDPCGTTPRRFEIAPQALNIIVPPKVPPGLFVRTESTLLRAAADAYST